ncbi:4'-phosphopantetheinyl transferase family protein [Haploplasma axanthum]|uniref:4'-phosphopantetheinyl transferase family protein n=1 Tax=Haploplasma axanthum TaxID=29552 RepID=UPI0003F66E08|nr:hypothetical protein [Haploplasma axanthum]
MSNINIYIYKFNENHSLKVQEFFSNYRLDKIQNIISDDYISRNIQIENIIFEILKKNGFNESKLNFFVGDNGRPYLIKSDLCFSISHSNEYLVIAISNMNLAVDIEKIDSKRMKIVKKMYYDLVDYSIDRVIMDWTIKESYIKYYDLNVFNGIRDIIIDKPNVFGSYGILEYKSYRLNDFYISIVSKEIEEIVINSVSLDEKDLISIEKCTKIYESKEEEE